MSDLPQNAARAAKAPSNRSKLAHAAAHAPVAAIRPERNLAVYTARTGPPLDWTVLGEVLRHLDGLKDTTTLLACAQTCWGLNDHASRSPYRIFHCDPASSHDAQIFQGRPKSTTHDKNPITRTRQPPLYSRFSHTQHLFVAPHTCESNAHVSRDHSPFTLKSVRLDNRSSRSADPCAVKVHETGMSLEWEREWWKCGLLDTLDYRKLVVVHGDTRDPFPVTQRLSDKCEEVVSVLQPFGAKRSFTSTGLTDWPRLEPRPNVKKYTLVVSPFRDGKVVPRHRALQKLDRAWCRQLLWGLYRFFAQLPREGVAVRVVTQVCNDKDWTAQFRSLYRKMGALSSIATRFGFEQWSEAELLGRQEPERWLSIVREGLSSIRRPKGAEFEALKVWLGSPEAEGVFTSEELALLHATSKL